jgi:predicted DNA-binding protein
LDEVIILKEKLILSKKLKGEDGYKTFSIRIKEETVEKIDALSDITNRTRNELIGILLEYAVENCEVE